MVRFLYNLKSQNNQTSGTMKLKLLALILSLLSLNSWAQTDTLEFNLIKQSINNGDNDLGDFQAFTKKWFKSIEKFGGYPNLPVDDNGQAQYSYFIQNDQLSKAELFQHSLEWLAVNQNILPNQTYNNLDDGKIIFYGSFPAEQFSCNYTGVLTIKEGKILFEFMNPTFQQFVQGHYSGDSWVSDQTISKPLTSLYPVYKQPNYEWSAIWQLFKITNKTIPDTVYSLSDYVQNYKQNNDF